MARPTNADVLAKYRAQIEQSKKWRNEEKYDDLWKRMIDLYRGKHYPTASGQDQLLVNIAFATINVMWPGVSVHYPKITVSARKFEQSDQATNTEAIVNYWWKHYDCQKEFRRAVKDALIIGHGWVKTGYRFVEEGEDHELADEMSSLSPESIAESDQIITEDRPFVERVSPFDVYVDADATSMSDMTWIAQRVKRPLEAVKKDERYAPAARKEASPSHYSKWGENKSTGGMFRAKRNENPLDAYVEIWEFYDIESGKMCVFCDGGDKFLVAPIEIPFSFGHPFVHIPNYEVPDHFYGMGELEAIEPLQLELNKTRTQMMNHRKWYTPKWLFRGSAFDAAGIEALKSDDENRMVEVTDSNVSLDNVVAPMPTQMLPSEFYNQSALISQDIDRVSGVSEYQRGSLPEIRRTATEAGIIQDAANARSSDKLAIIEKAIGETARRLVALAQQFMTGEQSVRVLGGDSRQAWLTFDRDYLQGEFDFEVEGGSTQPVNESFRRQAAMQVMDAMAPFIPANIIDLPKLANYVLQYGFGIKNSASFVLPPMGPGGMPIEEGADPAMQGQPPMDAPPGMM